MNEQQEAAGGGSRLAFDRMFALDAVGTDRFTTAANDGRAARVFGGQLLGQALSAALATVDGDRPVHSMQAMFLRSARSDRCFDLAVERITDGRSFSTRRVTTVQDGKAVLHATLSCHAPEDGPAFGPSPPQAPPPETLESEQLLRERAVAASGGSLEQAHAMRHLGFEIRPATPWSVTAPTLKATTQCLWVRSFHPAPAGSASRQAMLAYLSDTMLLTVALLPHGLNWATTRMDWGSLNHSIWLHRIPDFTNWLLWQVSAWWTGGARALSRAELFDRDGALVLSAAQEGLVRIRA